MAQLMYNPVTNSFTLYNPIQLPVQAENPLLGKFNLPSGYSVLPSNGVFIAPSNLPEEPAPEPERDILTERAASHYEGPLYTPTDYSADHSKKAVQIINKIMLLDPSLTLELASGIAGQINIESSLNFGSSNPNDLGKSSKGAILWNGDRLNSLKLFAKSKSKPWTNGDVLLEFLIDELKTKYSSNYNLLKLAKTPDEAAEALSSYILYAGYDGTLNSAKTLLKTKKWSDKLTMNYIQNEKLKRRNSALDMYNLWKRVS